MTGSWKTTLVGALLAIAVAVQPLISTGTIDWKAVVIGALIALLTYLAKDNNVTGGTKSNGMTIKGVAKKTAMILLFLGFVGVAYSQDKPKNSFFKPVSHELFKPSGTKAIVPSVWLFRPSVELSALQLTYDKTLKQFNSTSLTSAGIGVGYQHFIEVNGIPYNNVGINALILFGVQTSEAPASISLAATVSALQLVNVGFGYDFSGKKVFFLTGIVYNFN